MSKRIYPCLDVGLETPCRGGSITGRRFGLSGHLCDGHYGQRLNAEIREKKRADGGPPCTRCGTTGGYVKPNCTMPARYRGPGSERLCRACKWPDPVGRDPRPKASPPAPPPTLVELRLCKVSVLSERLMMKRSDEREAVRFERIERGPAGLTPAEAAQVAIREYRAATGTGGRS